MFDPFASMLCRMQLSFAHKMPLRRGPYSSRSGVVFVAGMVAQCSGQATQTSVSVIAAVKTRSSVTLFPPTPRVVIATFMTS